MHPISFGEANSTLKIKSEKYFAKIKKGNITHKTRHKSFIKDWQIESSNINDVLVGFIPERQS